eukprot:m.237746 g.237746  ORF g.237746 m.237746 type:complete len:167 (+) comp40150_c0_seq20:2043-2543(+)
MKTSAQGRPSAEQPLSKNISAAECVNGYVMSQPVYDKSRHMVKNLLNKKNLKKIVDEYNNFYGVNWTADMASKENEYIQKYQKFSFLRISNCYQRRILSGWVMIFFLLSTASDQVKTPLSSCTKRRLSNYLRTKDSMEICTVGLNSAGTKDVETPWTGKLACHYIL